MIHGKRLRHACQSQSTCYVVLARSSKGDAIQASEKIYKAVEECIKVHACLEGLGSAIRLEEGADGQSCWVKLHVSSLVPGEPLIVSLEPRLQLTCPWFP